MEQPTTPPNGDSSEAVLAAVEDFIQLQGAGKQPSLDSFLARYPAPWRPQIRNQCEIFLSLEDVVGPEPDDELEGAVKVGDFVLREELGRGGMGIVHLADQVSLKRQVALKVMNRGLSLSSRHVSRFRAEAKNTAALQHPGIVPIFESGDWDGTLYFAMEYVPGQDLAARIAGIEASQQAGESGAKRLGILHGQSYVQETASCVAQIADALSAAHEQGIIHRDIKPSNVLIGLDGRVRVVDFGLAKALGDHSASLSGELTGTPNYMSPEQTLAKRAPLDHRTDVFSLGVILYELLTLRKPFAGEDLQEIIYAICFRDPAPIHKVAPNVPRDLVTICAKALEKEPDARYATAADFAADLRRFLRFRPIQARPASLGVRLRKWTQRHTTLSALMLAAVLLLLAGAVWSRYANEVRAAQIAAKIEAADAATARGDLPGAVDLLVDAVKLAPDELELNRRLREARRSWQLDQAVNNQLLAQSAVALQSDPDLAVRLALMSESRSPTASNDANRNTRNAVLNALAQRYDSRELRSGVWRTSLDTVISRDARFAITASAFGEIRIWDLQDPPQEPPPAHLDPRIPPSTVLSGHRGHVWHLALSPDETVLASGGDDRSVRLWNLAERRAIGILRGHTNEIRHLTFSPDGKLLATGDRDGRLLLWNVATGDRLLEEHQEGNIQAIQFDPSGRWLAYTNRVARRRGLTRVLQVPDGEEVFRVENRMNVGIACPGLQFDPQGRFALRAFGDGRVVVYSLPGFEEARTIHANNVIVQHIDMAPDGTHIALGCYDSSVKLVQIRGDQMSTRTLVGPTERLAQVSFSGDSKRLVASSKDGKVFVFRVDLHLLIAQLQCRSAVTGTCFNESGRYLLTRESGFAAKAWDLDGSRPVRKLGKHYSRIRDISFHPDGRIATSGHDHRLRVFDHNSGRQIAKLRHKRIVMRSRFTRDGSRILVATDAAVSIHRAKDYSLIRSIPTSHRASDLSDDGALVAFGDVAGATKVLAVDSGKELFAVERPNQVRGVEFSPDASQIAVIEHSAHCSIFDVQSGAQQHQLHGQGFVIEVRWTRDGKRLIAAREDGTAEIFDAHSGKSLFVYRARAQNVQTVDISPDGTKALFGLGDSSVVLFDLDSQRTLCNFQAHQGIPRVVRFSPNGAFAVSGDHLGNVWTWPTNPLAAAHALKIRDLRLQEREQYGMLRPEDEEIRSAVDKLYLKHVLTRDVVAELESGHPNDPKLRAAIDYAIETPNPWARDLWSSAYRTVHSQSLSPFELHQAFRYAKAAVEILPFFPSAVRSLAYVYYRQDNYEAAWKELSKPCAQPEASSSPALLGYRTMCLWRLGRKDEAQEEFARFKEFATKSEDALTKRILAETQALLGLAN